MSQPNYMGICFYICIIILSHFQILADDFSVNQKNNNEFNFDSILLNDSHITLNKTRYKKNNLNLIIDYLNYNFSKDTVLLKKINFDYYGKRYFYSGFFEECEKGKDICEIKNFNLVSKQLKCSIDKISYDEVNNKCYISNLDIFNNSLLSFQYLGDLSYYGDRGSIKFLNSRIRFCNLEIPLPWFYYSRSEIKLFFVPCIYSDIKKTDSSYFGGGFHLFKKNIDFKFGIFAPLKKNFYDHLVVENIFRFSELVFTYNRFFESKKSFFDYNLKNDILKLFMDFKYLKSNFILIGEKSSFNFFYKQNTMSGLSTNALYNYKLKQWKSINSEDIYYIKFFNFGYKNDSIDRIHKIFIDIEGQYFEFLFKDHEVFIKQYGYTLSNIANLYISDYYLQISVTTKDEFLKYSMFSKQKNFNIKDISKISINKEKIQNLAINFLKKMNYVGELHLNDKLRLKGVVNILDSSKYINLKSFGVMFVPVVGSLEISLKDILAKEKRKISVTYEFEDICLDLYFLDLKGNFQLGMQWKQYIKNIPINLSVLCCYDEKLKSYLKFGTSFIIGYYNISIGYVFLKKKQGLSILIPNSFLIHPAADFKSIESDFIILTKQLNQLKKDIDHKVKVVNF